jgi:hypothetical protein
MAVVGAIAPAAHAEPVEVCYATVVIDEWPGVNGGQVNGGEYHMEQNCFRPETPQP